LPEPIVFQTASEMRAWSRAQHLSGKRIGFVPTMGALHDGHASLFRKARELSDAVAISIFVNPTQFGPGEDFEKYPRTLVADLEIAGKQGVAAVFTPGPAFYPQGYRAQVVIPEWNHLWEGALRPVHFDGVASVVTKLFHSVECDVAVFGQKDAQQALLLRRMVRDLDFAVQLVIAPIVREADGLALSSRNRYLSSTDRMRALSLSRALLAAAVRWEAGERSPRALLEAGRQILSQTPPDAIDYFSFVDPDTLACIDDAPNIETSALLTVAARYGSTRLIDNKAFGPVWD